jgi:MFS family permease
MPRKIFYGWWVVTACFIINLYVGGTIFFGFTAFFEPIREELGWSYTQISLASSLRGLEMGIFAPVVGFLVSRYGPRKLFLAGNITLGVALFLLSRVQSLAGFYIAFLLVAFGAGGCTSVVSLTAIANWFHKNVGIAMGIMASGFGASGLLVPIIVALIRSLGWRPTLVMLGAGAWLICIPLSLVVRDKPEEDEFSRTENALSDGSRAEEPKGPGFREAIRNRSFLYLNLAEALRMFSVTAIVVHVMPHLQHLGIERGTAGMIAASIPVVSILGRFWFGWLSDRREKRVVMSISFVIMSAGTLVYSMAGSIPLLLIFILLFATGLGGSMVLRGAILRDHFGRESFGKLIGVVLGSASVGGVLGPTAAGWVFDTLQSYRPMWVVLCGVTFLAAVVSSRIRPFRAERKAQESEIS